MIQYFFYLNIVILKNTFLFNMYIHINVPQVGSEFLITVTALVQGRLAAFAGWSSHIQV